MALTDPELDLLRELLEDDPTDDVFKQVAQELIRRSQWDEAEEVLTVGLAAQADWTEGWSLLARAGLESTHYDIAQMALERVHVDPSANPADAVVEILVLERSGQIAEARQAIEAYLVVDPHDVVVQSALERLDAPVSDVVQRTPDPMVSIARAEAYVAAGRIERAVRVYRRILLHNPGQANLEIRLRQLRGVDDGLHDDLSEELDDPRTIPPDFQMPAPRLSALAADDEITQPGNVSEILAEYAKGAAAHHPLPSEFDPDDEEDTDTLTVLRDENGEISKVASSRGKRRRRRSLINR